MKFAVLATLMVLGTRSVWYASAKPFLPQTSAERSALRDQEYQNVIVKLINAFANSQVQDRDEAPMAYYEQQEVNEEKINEITGLAKNPHMYGDLLLTPEQEKLLIINVGDGSEAQGFLNRGVRFWPNGIVPYELDSSLNSVALRHIHNSIREFASRSCIRFERRTQQNWMNYPNFVHFTSSSSGCFSYLGMIGRRQAVNIGRGCEDRGIVQHEILHALGRAHEQSRPDRDNYVIINMNNIRREHRHNFKILRADTSLPYDYGSVMHYGPYDFSSNGRPTIRTLRPASIGQRRGLSTTDWRHVQRAYCQRDNA